MGLRVPVKLKLRWLVSIAIISCIAIYYVPHAFQRPINRIRINARYEHLQPQEIQQVVIPLINKGFFTVNVAKIQHEVKRLPWVAKVGVRRVWPDTLLITIKEHKPLAVWKSGGVFDQNNELFYPTPETIPSGLPILDGPKNLTSKIFKAYQKLNPIFTSKQLSIHEITVSDRRSWTLILANNVEVVLGKQDHIAKVKRLMSVWDELTATHQTAIRRVDMRYPNGMAVS